MPQVQDCPGQFNLTKLNKKIQFSRVLNIALIIVLIGVIFFGWWYLRKQNPLDTLARITAPEIPQPKYLYTIYGSNTTTLNKPLFTAVENDKIYVADSKNDRIAIFGYDGKFLSQFGAGGAGRLRTPVYIEFIDSEIFVADTGTKKIHVFNNQGQFIRYFGDKSINMPIAVVYKNEKFFVLDGARAQIKVLDNSGKVLNQFGKEGGEQGAFYHPQSIYVTDDSKIYVVDSNNNRIQVFDLQGSFLQEISGVDTNGAGGYSIPRGLAFDKAGNLYTAEGLSNGVAIANKEGKVMFRFSYAEPTQSELGEDDTMKLPTSVFIDNNQRLYVTEYGKSRVLVYEIR